MKTILVVDDNADRMQQFAQGMQRYEVDIVFAQSNAEAMEKMEGRNFDAIALETYLPRDDDEYRRR